MIHGKLVCTAVILASTIAAGCANDGGFAGTNLTTSSVDTKAAAKVDPACQALSMRIDALRAEGATATLEKAATGKSTTVSVKRASLAKAAELDKSNAEFQTKCSTLPPRPVQAMAPHAPAGATTTTAVKPVASAAPVAPMAPATTPR